MDFPDLSAWEWALAALAALAVGISKTGFGGISLIAVVIMAELFGKPFVGIMLPMLIAADCMVYPLFRKFASWAPVWRLVPPTLLGCTAGYFFLKWIPDDWARPVIGGIILVMVALTLLRRFGREWFDRMAQSRTAGIGAGFTAGIATMMANAAGPVFQLYLVSRRFDKMDLVGVGARFFLLVNLLKAPFLGGLEFINADSLLFNLKLLPLIAVGVLAGKRLVQAVSQQLFEWLVIAFAIVLGLQLVLF